MPVTQRMLVRCVRRRPSSASEGPLHIRLKDSAAEGYVLCEQLKYIDLATRRFSKLPATHFFDVIDISDAIMGIFDYQGV